MICEKCGMHDRVTRTITDPKTSIVTRHRRCMKCGNVTTTEEKPVATIAADPKPKKKSAAPKKRTTDRPPINGALAKAMQEAN